MSVAPPTDIVLEVSRAADPARAAAVMARLNALAREGGDTGQDFATALNAADTASASAPGAPTRPAAAPAKTRAEKAETKFESVMLSEFISEMLPKDAPSAYGGGFAGDMWRSMLAEKIADQIAGSGRLGLAGRLFGDHPLASSEQLLKPDKGRGLNEAQAAQASANPLSSPGAADIDDGAYLFARSNPI